VRIGDLVELSAQGKKLDWLNPLHGLHGIIVKDHRFRFTVLWFDERKPKGTYHWHTIARKSLKHAR
jgi:hypothetical protein